MNNVFQEGRKFILTAGILALSFGLLLPSAGLAAQSSTPQESSPGQTRAHRRGNRMSPERQLSFLTKRLNLSQDQQAKIKPILENQHQQMMDTFKDSSLSRQQKREKFMEIHKNTTDQIKANLNSDQVTKFEQMQQQREQRMKEWRQQHGAGSQNAPPQSQQ